MGSKYGKNFFRVLIVVTSGLDDLMGEPRNVSGPSCQVELSIEYVLLFDLRIKNPAGYFFKKICPIIILFKIILIWTTHTLTTVVSILQDSVIPTFKVKLISYLFSF